MAGATPQSTIKEIISRILNGPPQNGYRLLKNGHLLRFRPPHSLGGVANSRSLLVATPPLVLALLDEVCKTFETSNNGGLSGAKKPSVFYLTGQVVAAYRQVRLTPQDFGSSRERDFSKLNLHLAPFEQPGENGFFSRLLTAQEWFGLYHIPMGCVC